MKQTDTPSSAAKYGTVLTVPCVVVFIPGSDPERGCPR
jgi:hypothetical protein